MGKYLIVLNEKTDLSFLNEYNVSNIEVHMGIIIFAHMSKEDAVKLSENKLIESIERDGSDSVDAISSDDRHVTAETTYAFNMMNVSRFHEEGITGAGFKIAILDTGVQKHINLKVTGGINVYDSSKSWNTELANSHGTMVAGVINAQGVNNELLGVAPDAELYAVRIDDGTGPINSQTWSSQIAGISWAVENGMDAVNCSFSSRIDSKARKTAFKLAAESGIAIFCSAGNTQPRSDVTTNTARYPAKYPFCIANANIDSNKVRYPTSCIGQGLNFSNGGTSLKLTTTAKNSSSVSSSYATGTGTSMATPATLGLYILYRQKFGEDKDKTLQRMSVNAEHLGDNYWYGAGLPKYPTNNYLNVQIRG